MAHTVVGKLSKAANEIPAQDGTIGFSIRIGEQYYDRESKTKKWTNYQAVVFAKQQAQIDFYRQSLVEGAIVAVTGDALRIDEYHGQNGVSLSLELQNARVGNVYSQQPQQQGYATQQGYTAPQQGYAPQQAPQGYAAPQQQYNPPPSQQPQYQNPQGAHPANFPQPPAR